MSIDITLSPQEQYPAVLVKEVTVELAAASSKWIQSIDVRIDDVDVIGRLKREGSAESARRVTIELQPPRNVETSLDLTARLRYKNLLKEHWRNEHVAVLAQDLRTIFRYGTGEKKEWRGTQNKITIIVGLTNRAPSARERPSSHMSIPSVRGPSSDHGGHLTPMTDDILRNCPRFRILVMGKTGVGKSQLINQTFGVTDAVVAHHERGYADIDKEILSKENPHFILHDSMGFESGDDANVKIVQRFINERSQMPLIKDQLHAVWLCIDIPRSGGRLLESGIEQFLRLKIEGKLGLVPVIAVFTKYDLLINHERRVLSRSLPKGLSKEAIAQLIKQNVQNKLQVICVEPFERFVDSHVPHVTVSTENDYAASLSTLIQLTYNGVREFFADASVVSAIAQRVSPRVNIQASIAVGRRKYWQRLASSINFPGKTLQQCLDVIHADIIAVWQFDDPDGYLSSGSFKALITSIVTEEGKMDSRLPDHKKTLAAGISLIAGIAGIVSALSGPASPIVIPIAACFVLGKWVYDVYQQTTAVLRRLMTYIIDLTLILQNIFWLQMLTNAGHPITRRIVKAAALVHHKSNIKQTLRFKIDEHLQSISFDVGPDTTLTAIIELIEAFTIDSAEMFEQRGNLSFPNEGPATVKEEWEETTPLLDNSLAEE